MTGENETARVAIVGAGNIGGRHLQALVLSERPLEVYVVDPSPGALGHAAARVDEVASNEHVSVRYLGLLDTGGCGLPSDQESSAIHLAMLAPFLQAIGAHRDSPRQFWIT